MYRIRYRNALKKVNGVYVRDPYSKTVFEKSYCVSAKCFADVVFTYGNEKICRKKINTILCNILSYDLLDFADYLIYYTRKEVTYELLTQEYNYWR